MLTRTSISEDGKVNIDLIAIILVDKEKGDIIFKYRPNQIGFLKSKGYIKGLTDFEEF